MPQHKYAAAIGFALLLACNNAVAQTEGPQPSSRDQAAETDPLSVVDSVEAALPLLMDHAKSDDPEIAAWAMAQIPALIEQVRKLKQQSDRIAEQRRLGIEGLDTQMVQYAKRLIGRYDLNGDQELSPEEYAKLLQSPAEADTDENGRVSLGEYAAWLQSRHRRRQ
ncbi:hypothetical protein Mal15_03510 [Stieleria maiorica]|uniref:EF hand n=1 Tax=Stieleria maiorica TaxID=2795974 RepID=A0A5B9M9T1_9BACT|nr:hypothetical protein [Stieleria maiorica]QEF96324.1 hypothetical protein Mal15_03510 [Stieleria maiorica]